MYVISRLFPSQSDKFVLNQALPTNLFPIAIQLPDGTIFMAASSIAMIYNPETSVERRLADIPSGVRVSTFKI